MTDTSKAPTLVRQKPLNLGGEQARMARLAQLPHSHCEPLELARPTGTSQLDQRRATVAVQDDAGVDLQPAALEAQLEQQRRMRAEQSRTIAGRLAAMECQKQFPSEAVIGAGAFRALSGLTMLSELLVLYGQRHVLFGIDAVIPYRGERIVELRAVGE